MLPANPIVGIESCNCFTLRRAARQISRAYDAHLQPTGLRITQFLILTALAEVSSAAVNELAERLDVERTAMGKMIGFLERDGAVRLRPSPTDGRSRLVELTEAGSRLYQRALPLWRAAQAEFEQANGRGHVAGLRRSLSAMKSGHDVRD